MEVFDATSIFPAEAVPFATEEADMDRALSVLSDLAQARDLVRETGELMRRLNDGIAGPNQVTVFADTRRQRQRTTALRNRAAILRKGMIGLEEDRATGGADLASVRAARKQLESTIESMPDRDTDFDKRDQELLAATRPHPAI